MNFSLLCKNQHHVFKCFALINDFHLDFRSMLEIYSNPVAIEPLMPIAERGRLAELSFEILQESGRLAGLVRSPWVFQEVASVVRGMNC
jgi:hypothetical protein